MLQNIFMAPYKCKCKSLNLGDMNMQINKEKDLFSQVPWNASSKNCFTPFILVPIFS